MPNPLAGIAPLLKPWRQVRRDSRRRIPPSIGGSGFASTRPTASSAPASSQCRAAFWLNPIKRCFSFPQRPKGARHAECAKVFQRPAAPEAAYQRLAPAPLAGTVGAVAAGSARRRDLAVHGVGRRGRRGGNPRPRHGHPDGLPRSDRSPAAARAAVADRGHARPDRAGELSRSGLSDARRGRLPLLSAALRPLRAGPRRRRRGHGAQRRAEVALRAPAPGPHPPRHGALHQQLSQPALDDGRHRVPDPGGAAGADPAHPRLACLPAAAGGRSVDGHRLQPGLPRRPLAERRPGGLVRGCGVGDLLLARCPAPPPAKRKRNAWKARRRLQAFSPLRRKTSCCAGRARAVAGLRRGRTPRRRP